MKNGIESNIIFYCKQRTIEVNDSKRAGIVNDNKFYNCKTFIELNDFCFRWIQEMALNNISPDELKRLFEFIVRFDRIDGSNQVSISPTFYARLYCTKVSREAFLCFHFRFELFLAQEYWCKWAHKILVKSTTGLQSPKSYTVWKIRHLQTHSGP
jgi:hypothetical protein